MEHNIVENKKGAECSCGELNYCIDEAGCTVENPCPHCKFSMAKAREYLSHS